MRVLIAGAGTGYGHFQAGINLARELKLSHPGIKVHYLNIHSACQPGSRFILANCWELLSITSVVRELYRQAHRAVTSNLPLSRLVHWGLDKSVEFTPPFSSLDHLIVTHPAAVPFGVAMKRRFGCQLSVVATDFIVHNLHCDPLVDRYFIPPQAFIVGRLAERAGRNGQLIATGIPVGSDYANDEDHIEKGKAENNGNLLHAVVTFGAMGYRMNHHLRTIVDLVHAEPKVCYTIVTGHNIRVRKRLEAALNGRKNESRVKIRGFVTRMSSLLKRADFVIGKAGGLTISEAFSLGLPTAIMDVLPGQEDYNARAVISRNLGIRPRDTNDVLSWIHHLSVPTRLTELGEAIRLEGRPQSASQICVALLGQGNP